jgi:hypothetical protein
MAGLNSRSGTRLARAPTAALGSGPPAADIHDVEGRSLDGLELRLGVALPPSYRGFLGAADHVGGPGLHDLAAVGWSYDRETPRPGHLRFALDAGQDRDGRRVLLDPLATGRDGEWEAWAAGPDGGVRYRSFGALLAGDTGDPADPDGLPADPGELAALVCAEPVGPAGTGATAGDDAAAALRVAAVRRLVRLGEGGRVRDVLVHDAADLTIPTERRVLALRWLGGTGDAGDVTLLVAAAGDPRSAVRAAVLPWLASSEVARARQAAVELLVRSGVETVVMRAARGPAAWALADAWNLAGDPRLLVQLAACGDARAVAGLVEAVADPRTPASVRAGLVRYAASPGNPAVVAPLIEAAGMPGASSTAVAAALRRLEPPILRAIPRQAGPTD